MVFDFNGHDLHDLGDFLVQEARLVDVDRRMAIVDTREHLQLIRAFWDSMIADQDSITSFHVCWRVAPPLIVD